METKLLLTSDDPPLFSGDGGSYRTWTSEDYPILDEAKVGAGLLILKPGGFALPHYADCTKIGYVLQGEEGVAGVLPTNIGQTNETLVSLKTGVIIPVVKGSTSWWYNHTESKSDLVIAFLGETKNSHVPGQFTYFFFSGVGSILSGFSTEFITKAYNITETEADTLTKSQRGVLIIKLSEEEGKKMPKPGVDDENDDVWVESVVEVERGGKISRFGCIEGVGLRCSVVKVEGDAMLSPGFSGDGSVEVVYVGSGSGRVEIVGVNGKRALDSGVVAGQIFVVPSFYTFAVVADGDGIEIFSIKTSARYYYYWKYGDFHFHSWLKNIS